MGQPVVLRRRAAQHHGHIGRTQSKKEAGITKKNAVGPAVLAVLLFVVLGSAVLQIFHNMRTRSPFA